MMMVLQGSRHGHGIDFGISQSQSTGAFLEQNSKPLFRPANHQHRFKLIIFTRHRCDRGGAHCCKWKSICLHLPSFYSSTSFLETFCQRWHFFLLLSFFSPFLLPRLHHCYRHRCHIMKGCSGVGEALSQSLHLNHATKILSLSLSLCLLLFPSTVHILPPNFLLNWILVCCLFQSNHRHLLLFCFSKSQLSWKPFLLSISPPSFLFLHPANFLPASITVGLAIMTRNGLNTKADDKMIICLF